jgi:hypothetical protein
MKSAVIVAAMALSVVAGLCPSAARASPSSPEPSLPRPAVEANVLWPFIGIGEFKVLLPLFGNRQFRGELLAGTYADYAQIIGGRPNDPGKVFILAPLVGYRQFFTYGIHLELGIIAGVRHEDNYEGQQGMTLNDFYVRAFPMLGWQWELSDRFYANARGGAGILVYRQTHEAEETKVLPAGDINVGFRF